MAIWKGTGLVSEATGSDGGAVWSRGRGQQRVCVRRLARRTATKAQTDARTLFSRGVSALQVPGYVDVEGWKNYEGGRRGWFEAVLGSALRSFPAGSGDVFAPPVRVTSPWTPVLTVTAFRGAGVIAVATSPATVPAGQALFVRGGLRPGITRNSCPGGMKNLAVLVESTSMAYDLTPDWERRFGAWSVGQALRVECLPYSVDSRIPGRWIRADVTVQA